MPKEADNKTVHSVIKQIEDVAGYLNKPIPHQAAGAAHSGDNRDGKKAVTIFAILKQLANVLGGYAQANKPKPKDKAAKEAWEKRNIIDLKGSYDEARGKARGIKGFYIGVAQSITWKFILSLVVINAFAQGALSGFTSQFVGQLLNVPAGSPEVTAIVFLSISLVALGMLRAVYRDAKSSGFIAWINTPAGHIQSKTVFLEMLGELKEDGNLNAEGLAARLVELKNQAARATIHGVSSPVADDWGAFLRNSAVVEWVKNNCGGQVAVAALETFRKEMGVNSSEPNPEVTLSTFVDQEIKNYVEGKIRVGTGLFSKLRANRQYRSLRRTLLRRQLRALRIIRANEKPVATSSLSLNEKVLERIESNSIAKSLKTAINDEAQVDCSGTLTLRWLNNSTIFALFNSAENDAEKALLMAAISVELLHQENEPSLTEASKKQPARDRRTQAEQAIFIRTGHWHKVIGLIVGALIGYTNVLINGIITASSGVGFSLVAVGFQGFIQSLSNPVTLAFIFIFSMAGVIQSWMLTQKGMAAASEAAGRFLDANLERKARRKKAAKGLLALFVAGLTGAALAALSEKVTMTVVGNLVSTQFASILGPIVLILSMIAGTVLFARFGLQQCGTILTAIKKDPRHAARIAFVAAASIGIILLSRFSPGLAASVGLNTAGVAIVMIAFTLVLALAADFIDYRRANPVVVQPKLEQAGDGVLANTTQQAPLFYLRLWVTITTGVCVSGVSMMVASASIFPTVLGIFCGLSAMIVFSCLFWKGAYAQPKAPIDFVKAVGERALDSGEISEGDAAATVSVMSRDDETIPVSAYTSSDR